MCANCGLVYLIDRFTAAGYARYYGDGYYRSISSLYNGSRGTVEGIREIQAGYAADLVGAIDGYVKRRNGGQLLDIGGSVGLVARKAADHFGLKATVLEPSPTEAEAARGAGLDAIVGSLEEWNTEERFDLILMCRTIEHLFDLSGSLSKIRSLLREGGLFYCDSVDFLEACRQEGSPQVTTKADHCFWLCQETAPGIFRSAGFEIVSTNTVCGPHYVGFLLRACSPQAEAAVMPSTWIDTQVRRLRETEAEWDASGHVPYDARDRLRRNAYRLKRKIGSLVGR